MARILPIPPQSLEILPRDGVGGANGKARQVLEKPKA